MMLCTSCVSFIAIISYDATVVIYHALSSPLLIIFLLIIMYYNIHTQTRQLNLWGFTRDTNSGAWQHEDFIRGSVELIQNIKRIEIKGKAIVSIKKKTSMKPQKKKHQSVATATRSSSRKPRPPIRHRVPSPGSVYTDSDGSLSIQDGTVISLSPVTEKNTIAKIPENVSTCLIPNNTFQSSGTHEAPAHTNSTTTPHDQYCHQAAAISYPTPIRTNITGNNNNNMYTMSSSCQPYQMPLPRRDMTNQHAYSRPRDTIQHPSSMMMPPHHQPEEINSNSTSDDMLYLLSGVFEPDQLSTQESNDLSSILSLNDDVSQD